MSETAVYQLCTGGVLLHHPDGSTTAVPQQPASPAWRAYEAWLAAGGQPLPAEEEIS